MQSVRTLMAEIIDYAGLFPPAALTMAEAVKNFASYLESPDAWMLGRFVIPVARLDEFERAAAGLLPQINGDEPWRLSALTGPDLDADIERIFAFNQAHDAGVGPDGSSVGGALIDTIELKASSADEIDRALRIIPEQLEPFIEIPLAGDPRGMIAALAGTGARAKVRTGGVVPSAFPEPGPLSGFLAACAAADVPFKATAGLHHPLRGEYPLTYEPGCPRGVMFGFLNVFLAAALIRAARLPPGEAEAVLVEGAAEAFQFDNEGVMCRGVRLENTRLARVREAFAMSFGSCSFAEPVEELRSMKLLRT